MCTYVYVHIETSVCSAYGMAYEWFNCGNCVLKYHSTYYSNWKFDLLHFNNFYKCVNLYESTYISMNVSMYIYK